MLNNTLKYSIHDMDNAIAKVEPGSGLSCVALILFFCAAGEDKG
jgi:hypothetical protein